MKLTEEQIKEISEELQLGMRCLYNMKTEEIKSVMDFSRFPDADEELWEDDLNEIEENWDDYFEFDSMESRDEYQVMAEFVENVDDEKLKEKLEDALNGPKPFKIFKWQIDNSGPYRQKWFDYRDMRSIEWVKQQIEV